MRKKTVCAAFAALLILITAVSAFADGGVITDAALTIEEPSAGKTPAELSLSFSANIEGALASSSVRWYVEDGGWVEIAQTSVFEAGETYSFDFRGRLAPGFTASPSVKGTVNGRPSQDELGSVYASDSEIYLSQTFGPLEGDAVKRTAIKAVELAVTEPEEGKTPKDIGISIKTEPEGVDLSYDIYWFEADRPSENKDDWRELGQNEKFVSGKYYAPDVYVYAPDGFRFKAGTKFTVNGEASDEIFADSFTNSREGYMSAVFGPVKKAEPMPFSDVDPSDHYAAAVLWGYYAEPQVTDGVGNGLFGPERTCTRGQVVTFLWRAFGRPEPETKENPFTDVKSSDYFYDAVLWAVENGITDGTAPDKFSPDTDCRQSHILTFVYRAMGSPDESKNPEPWYSDAYDWAVSQGLTEFAGGSFDINSLSPRRDVIYYMYRCFAKK